MKLHTKKTLSVKCGNVSGGDCTRQLLTLKTCPRELPLETFTARLPTPRRNKEGKINWLCSMRHLST